MTYELDDPRLTAYALGELDGVDLAAVEAILADSPEARREVEEIQALAGVLTQRLAAESPPALSPEQKQAIASELGQAPEPPVRLATLPGPAAWHRLALAAGLLLAVGLGGLAWLQSRPDAQAPEAGLLARNDEVPALRSRFDAPAARPEVASVAPAPAAARGAHPADSELMQIEDEMPPPSPAMGRTYDLALNPRESDAADNQLLPDFGLAPGLPEPSAAAEGEAPLVLTPIEAAPPASSGGVAAGGTPLAPGRTGQDATDHLAPGMMGQGAPQGSRLASAEAQQGQAQGPHVAPGMMGQGAPQGSRLARAEAQQGQAQGPQGFGRFRSRSVENGESRDQSGGIMGMSPRGTFVDSKPQAGFAKREERLGEESGEVLAKKLGPNEPLAAVVPEAIKPGTPAADSPEPVALGLNIQTQPAPIENERFPWIVENPFEAVTPGKFSTFSIDVDTASYANVRRYLTQNMLPPPDAVRIEEMVNYFDYDYSAPSPADETPFAVHTEAVRCPWNPDHQLLRIGLKGQAIDFADREPSNLVFLVDVSGSMDQPNKLPLVKAGLRMLAEQLGENDRVALVVYAGRAGVALPSTPGHRKSEILTAIDRLEAGGSTNGGEGLARAYEVAVENFREGGVNRVILATDGDFNTGSVQGADAVADFAQERAKATGVFLSVLGVGEANLNDELMKKVANRGNGVYYYLDSLMEARRVLVEQVGGTLVTIAKDVKIQVDFNPAKVGAYRLIGYESRLLADADFLDDSKDAGEIGSAHAVTALYELVSPGEAADRLARRPEPSKYAKPAEAAEHPAELLTVRLRYKNPDGNDSKPIEHPVPDAVKSLADASADTKFAAAVAEFGMLLRGSRFVGQGNLDAVLELARANLGPDPQGRRAEFVELVEKARALRSR